MTRNGLQTRTLRTAARVCDAAKRVAHRMLIRDAYPFDADEETRPFY